MSNIHPVAARRRSKGLRAGVGLALAASLLFPAGAASAVTDLGPTPAVTVSPAPTFTSKPDNTGPVQAVDGSWSAETGASLTYDWADVPRAARYNVFLSTDPAAALTMTVPTVVVTESEATIADLRPGTQYTVRVVAENNVGRGAGSARVTYTTLTEANGHLKWHSTRPDAAGTVRFTGASRTATSATLDVDWADVKRATGYDVFVSTNPDVAHKMTTPTMRVTASKATLTGLAKGVTYYVKVAATNNISAGPSSWRVGQRTPTVENLPVQWHTATPEGLGLVTFTGASLTPTGATLTVDWPDVKRATSYYVFASTSFDAVLKMTAPTMVVPNSAATLTKLKKGVNYFVRVVPYNNVGAGPGSSRVGHSTIVAETSAGKTQAYSLLTWNVCSNACSNFAKRKTVIDSRIREVGANIVALQEASKYTKAPAGYSFVANGQNDILVRNGVFSKVAVKKKVATTGKTTFARKYTTPGKGVMWAALRHKSGQYAIVFNVHLGTGTSKAQMKQRQYEAERLALYINATVSTLGKTYSGLKNAAVVILGDVNTSNSTAGDTTLAVFKKKGWYDAFEQARKLTGQHDNSANPKMSASRIIAVTWGAHVDKVLVKPSRTIITSWANAGKMKNGKYVTPLGSDHHPILVTGIFK